MLPTPTQVAAIKALKNEERELLVREIERECARLGITADDLMRALKSFTVSQQLLVEDEINEHYFVSAARAVEQTSALIKKTLDARLGKK